MSSKMPRRYKLLLRVGLIVGIVIVLEKEVENPGIKTSAATLFGS
jgi:hypothetical protein